MHFKYSATFSRLLDAGLALPREQRLAWVDGLGDEFAAIKPRLRALIARSCLDDTNELLATLPKLERVGAQTVARFDAAAHAAGSLVGPYRLVRCLGMGAMGVVWLASRQDGAAPREVALKFAHVAERRPDLLARMAREQQLLAALDHPNIARLYEAGVTPEGQPYLVLEYVAGSGLGEYCSAQQLSTTQLLQLFQQIARAVAHAHERQIVHRDLKPANVMVTDAGSVRLLDFGIGKLLTDGLPAQLQLSLLTGQPLTPAYASPEQVLGAAAGLPSDVYSLGVVLYELLTGARPYIYRRGSNRGLRQAILEVVPAPPSARRHDPALGDALRAELDTIVLRALHKEPRQRYPSARELAADIERVLLRERVPR
jgi:serine/threonine-protein kinase